LEYDGQPTQEGKALNDEQEREYIIVTTIIKKQEMLRLKSTNEIEEHMERLLMEPKGLTYLITYYCLIHDVDLKKYVGLKQ